jgi:hypothetical protein
MMINRPFHTLFLCAVLWSLTPPAHGLGEAPLESKVSNLYAPATTCPKPVPFDPDALRTADGSVVRLLGPSISDDAHQLENLGCETLPAGLLSESPLPLTSGTRSSANVTFENSSGNPDSTQSVFSRYQKTGSMEGSLSYHGESWNAGMSSTYSSDHDQLQPVLATSETTHALNGTIRPTRELSITPNLTLRHARQQWSGLSTETPTAALGLSYTPIPSLSYTAGGSYSETVGIGGTMRLNTFNATSGLTLKLPRPTTAAPSLSLDTSYSQTQDAYNRGSAHLESVSGTLRLQIPFN